MDGGPAKRPRLDGGPETTRFLPLSAPMGWCHHDPDNVSAPTDFIFAARFPASHYPAFARSFAEHKLQDAVVQAQSVLLLYLQGLQIRHIVGLYHCSLFALLVVFCLLAPIHCWLLVLQQQDSI